jgi:rubrerythrin
VATPGAGPDGAGAPELEVGVRPGPADHDRGLAHGEVAWRGAETAARWSARASSTDSGRPQSAEDGRPEEVAVCELCGLVSRRPLPMVCPACGGGYG